MSEPIKVLITPPFPEELLDEVRGVSPLLEISQRSAKTPEDIPPDVWEMVEILYTNDVLPPPEKVPNLRWVQLHWAGIDSLVEAPLLGKNGLSVTTLSGASASQMAEYILAMLLALGHHLPVLIAHQARAEWPKDRWERFEPRELRGSTVGIIGYGSVGRQVAHLLQRFGATVLATKRDAKHPEDGGYIPEGLGDPGGDLVHRLYPPQALKAMLKECDYVIIAVPLTPETRGLVGAAELAAMKPGAYLVDVSRGLVVDHAALAQVLREKKIAGAALDVFPEEPLPAESPLWKLPNVVLTPHIAGVTNRYDLRAVRLFMENLERYLAGKPLYNLYHPERGY
jgi:phosphoglycerate dehydrogenase-like enzyme